jgi:hypothetical protein
VRGIAFSDEDRVHAPIIERQMCDFTFSERQLDGAPRDIAQSSQRLPECVGAASHLGGRQ